MDDRLVLEDTGAVDQDVSMTESLLDFLEQLCDRLRVPDVCRDGQGLDVWVDLLRFFLHSGQFLRTRGDQNEALWTGLCECRSYPLRASLASLQKGSWELRLVVGSFQVLTMAPIPLLAPLMMTTFPAKEF